MTATGSCQYGSALSSHFGGALEGSDQAFAWSLASLDELVGAVGLSRPLLVTAEDALRDAGVRDEVEFQLSRTRHACFNDYTPNPTHEQAVAAAERASAHGADGVVCIGGGSCMDIGKMAALGAPLSTCDRAIALAGGTPRAACGPLPIIAVPTTSGTGSEATPFAAIYADGRKVSVAHPGLRPRAVLFEERFALAMPAGVAASSGLDALCQALESWWAVGATDESARDARRSLGISAAHLVPGCVRGSRGARAAMVAAAYLAGRAISISKTTACHAISYQLTTRYGLSHGHAVALTLGEIARLNERVGVDDCADPRGPEQVRKRVREGCGVLGAGPDEMPARMREVLDNLGLAANLRDAGVREGDLREIAEGVDPVRLGNNPRRLTTGMLSEVLHRAYMDKSCATN